MQQEEDERLAAVRKRMARAQRRSRKYLIAGVSLVDELIEDGRREPRGELK
jgi:hypothetical protein